ncbi:MAG: DNA-binding protein WhiA [Oscillospiraceae bacterium]|nr:DNA-binding protein WhiA [Oscillospiraceae bacterium]
MRLSFSHEVKKEIRSAAEQEGNNAAYASLSEAFLSFGSIAEPAKDYHLEFTPPTQSEAENLLKTLNGFGITAGLTERKGAYVVYVKNSEAIEDFLTMAGAPMAAVELMNVKIYKDVRNKANRIANCDTANIERTLKAAEKHTLDIEYISKTSGLGILPKSLKSIAKLRLENPEISLRELGELLDKPLSRSGVNHRLKRISEIAEGLRNGS